MPVADGTEIPQQCPHLADGRANHGARVYLGHVNLLCWLPPHRAVSVEVTSGVAPARMPSPPLSRLGAG